MKTTNSIYEIRVEMWRKGGEFVRQLAQALKAADLDNQRRPLPGQLRDALLRGGAIAV